MAMIALVGIPSLYYMQYYRFDPNLNLIPFRGMIRDLRNCLLNVALFVPLGILLPCLWKRFRSGKATVLEGFRISLFIELSQMITSRATDVNDLMANTLGALLGFFIAKLLMKIFPKLAVPGFEAKERFVVYGAVLVVMVIIQPYIAVFFWDLLPYIHK